MINLKQLKDEAFSMFNSIGCGCDTTNSRQQTEGEQYS